MIVFPRLLVMNDVAYIMLEQIDNAHSLFGPQ